MKKNMGTTDRTIRLILGIGIIAAGLYFKSWWGLAGIVLLATAGARFCPTYWPFKISTIKNES